MEVEFIGKTDVGIQREANEDSFGILKSRRFAVVCDGMGGHVAGEIASRSVVETLLNLYESNKLETVTGDSSGVLLQLSDQARFLVNAIRIANTRTFLMSEADSRLSGMGTTVVAIVINDGLATVCHVGDSRAYLIRNHNLNQLTTDHSLVGELLASGRISQDEAACYPNRNIITRALGVRERVTVDVREQSVEASDLFLLCSDGLTGKVNDMDILRIINENKSDLNMIVDKLIAAANDAGGEDNITCVLARVLNVPEKNTVDAEMIALTVPEETDTELATQRIVSDAVNSQTEKSESNSPDVGDSDTDSVSSASHNFYGIIVLFLFSAAILFLLAYVTNTAGMRGVLSRIFGLD